MFLDIINDIEKAIDKEAYLSALALALTLPDICGKVEYPELKNNKARYITWYDKYVTDKNHPEDMEMGQSFDGEKCYQLRCSFLHAGEVGEVKGIEKFTLAIYPRIARGIYSGGYVATTTDQNGNTSCEMEVNVLCLCFIIYSCAKGFYLNYNDKEKFNSICKIVKREEM